MSQSPSLQEQLEIAQAEIQRLSEQLAAQQTAAQQAQVQLQSQIEQQQARIINLEAQEITCKIQFEDNPQPMWIYDLETLGFLAVNDAAITKYGYTRDEFLNMTIADIRPLEDVPRLLASISEVRTDLNLAGLWRHCLKDGSLIYVEIVSYALYFEGRRAQLVMVQDVTGRLRAENFIKEMNEELEQQVKERTAALAASESRLNLLLNNNPATIYSCQPDGDFTCNFISQNIETILGYTPQEVYSHSNFWLDSLHPDDKSRVLSEITELFNHGVLKHEYRLRHCDGHYIWVHDELMLLRDPAGQPIEIFGFTTDISDRKEAESRIKEQLTTIETATDGIGITQNNCFLYANRAQLDMFGYTADELLGQSWTILYSADEMTRLEREVVPLFMRDRSWLGETIATRKDGTTFNQELSLTLSEDGLVIGVSKDITARKQAEIALRDSHMRYITLAQSVPVGIFRFDLEGNCIYVNDTWCSMTGKSACFALENRWLETIHPDDVNYTQAKMQQWFQANDGAIFQNEARVVRDDGTIVWFYCQMRVEVDASGKPIGYVGNLTDITDYKQAEIKLQHLSDRLTLAMEAGGYGVWEWNLEQDIIWDDQVYAIYGMKNQEKNIKYEDWRTIVHPDDIDRVELESHVLEENQIFNTEFRIYRPDGEIRWVKSVGKVQRDREGNTIRMVGINSDITKRKQAEIDLKNYAKAVEDLYNNAPCGYCSLDTNNVITQVNNTALRWLDYPRELVIGKPITHFMTVNSRKIFENRHKLLVQSDQVKRLNYEIVLLGSDSGQMTVLFSDEAQKDVNHQIMGSRITITDIRQRIKAEKLVQQKLAQANLLRQITTRIRQSLEISTIFDTACNEMQQALQADRVAIFQFHEASNYNDGEFIAESVVNAYPSVKLVPVHDHCFGDNFANLYSHGRYYAISDIEFGNLTTCHEDILRQFQVRANLVVPLVKGDNALWGLLCVHQCSQPRLWHTSEINFVQQFANQLAIGINQANLFEQLQQELGERQLAEQTLAERNQQLLVSNTELERATRLKDEFLANMSHELRTPLNSILGMTEGLQDQIFGAVNERQLKALDTIEKSGNHLLSLINDILDVAKIASGEIKLEFSSVTVERLCNSSLAFLKQQALKKRISLVNAVPSDLPDLYVDEVRIRQVLLNLLTNAVKFTPEGGIVTLAASLITPPLHTDQPIYLRFSVTDTGIGISQENIARLFKPFVQIDSALNRKQMGTGLGLTLVKQMAELHGGHVGLTSEVGVGSCFTVDLPYPQGTFPKSTLGNLPSVSTKAIVSDVERAKNTLGSLELTNHTTTHYLILLADDNPANVLTICSYLEMKGYQFVCANNGEEAIELALTHQPDLILMDIQMPQMDGLEALRQIRQQESLRETPIIALTALTMAGDQERCLAAGANAYFSKPIKLKRLDALIKELLH